MRDPYLFASRNSRTWFSERPWAFLGLAQLTLALTLSSLAEAQGLNLTGRWTTPSDTLGHMSIHMALLRGDANHHSKILSWEFKDGGTGKLWGWNPSEHGCATYPASQFQILPLDLNVPGIFCAGHSTLATGELMIAGGTDSFKVHVGERRSIIFRPNPGPGQSQWSSPVIMNAGRYYPTCTTLPDGKVLVTSGERFSHMLVFGGTEAPQDPGSAARNDINRLGLNSNGQWDPTISQQGAPSWPDAREGHSAVWHQNQLKMIVFGGRASNGPRSDAWLLQVTSTLDNYLYTWSPIPNAPGRRTRHAAVLLSNLNNRMIVYGGRDEFLQPSSAVWELTRDAFNVWQWAQLAPTGVSPGARYGHGIAYDQDNKRILVFGGLTTDDASFADDKVYALTFDVNPPAWSELSAGAGPAAREGYSLVMDPAPRTGGPFGGTARRMVLFGGRTSLGGPQNDLWELWIHPTTGQVQWRSAPLTVGPQPTPAVRSRHAATWDGVLDRMVVYGGSTGTAASAEAWALTWNANSSKWSWSQLASQPSFALGGHTAVFNPASIWAKDPELFNPSSGSFQLQNSPRQQPYYPFMFVVPSGNLFFAGSSNPTYLYKRNITPPVWQLFPDQNSLFAGGSAVMYRPGEVMKCGRPYDESCNASGQTAKIKIDVNDFSTGWVTSTNMMKTRTYHNLTVLPTGKVLVTGGLEECAITNPSVREPELWDPDAGPGAWSGLGVLASDPARRAYHSTALLLPDGRVLSAGGESRETNPDFWNRATIFCPPYLFNENGSLAHRPLITDACNTVAYGERFKFTVADSASITTGACIIRPSAVTHSFNQNQRYVPLTMVRESGSQTTFTLTPIIHKA